MSGAEGGDRAGEQRGDPVGRHRAGEEEALGEVDAEALLKGTHSGVEGVYTADPQLHPDAELLREVSYTEVLTRGLKVMDPTAITVCMENALPIAVFDVLRSGNLRSILEGGDVGTLVR